MLTFKCKEEVSEYLKDVVAHLDSTVGMSNLDPMPLGILGTQLNIFAECAAAIAEEGLVVTNMRGTPIPNPKLNVMNQAETMALKIMKEYGLLPKSRKDLGKEAEPAVETPLDAFLKKKK